MKFRSDINTLRAVAVLSVLLYHFGVPGFAGGFVGVDVFFVISGYLMTNIILGGLAEGRFSLIRFYLARARRIIPALAALVVVLILLGWFFLPPSDYAGLGLHGASSSLFFSNFVYKGEDGYFDVPSRTKWLLHTWSLSVEWQFYLIYPLLLALLWRKRGSATRMVAPIGVLAGVSLLASILLSADKASFSFYLLPTRLWEMALGGLVLAIPAAVALPARASALVGYALIAASIFTLDHNDVWPGYLALLPTIGTALVIRANDARLSLGGVKPLQAVGTWSYSLYLWHWPFVVALAYANMSDNPAAISVAMALCLGAAVLSYIFVEAPFRDLKGNRRTWVLFGLMTFLPAAVGLGLYAADGIPARVTEQVRILDTAVKDRYAGNEHCSFDKKALHLNEGCPAEHAAFAVWGDSHAGAVYSAVKAAAKERAGVLLTYSSCPTIFNAYVVTKRDKTVCPAFNDAALAALKKMPPRAPVIVANRYAYYLEGRDTSADHRMLLGFTTPVGANKSDKDVYVDTLSQSLCRIKRETGRSVYALKPVPEMGLDVPRTLARHAMIFLGRPLPELTRPFAEYEDRQKTVLDALSRAQKDCGIGIIDTPAAFCANGVCQSYAGENIFYFDDNHLSEDGNKKLVPLLKRIFKN